MTVNPKRTLREDEEGLEAESSGQPMVPQDTYRKVLFGQASDPLFPPHPEPPEVPESELRKLALADAPEPEPEVDRPGTPLLRWFLLVAIALVALAFLVHFRSR